MSLIATPPGESSRRLGTPVVADELIILHDTRKVIRDVRTAAVVPQRLLQDQRSTDLRLYQTHWRPQRANASLNSGTSTRMFDAQPIVLAFVPP